MLPVHRTLCALLFASCGSGTFAATQESDTSKVKVIYLNAKKTVLREVGTLPKILKEASGLTYTTSKHFWSHNDDGIPALYCLDSVGNQLKAVQLNIQNRGWEDLAQDESGNVYIGGFGNNKNDKKELRIYKVKDLERVNTAVVQPEIITYKYGDQKEFPPPPGIKNFDADAFIAYRGALLLFTKNRTSPFTGYSKIYKLSQQPGEHVAEVIDSLFVGKGPMMNNWITGAAISPDQKTIALLFHNRIWLIRNFKENKISAGTIYQIDLHHYSHKAGVSFKGNDTLYIVDELELDLIGGKLYTVDLKPFMKQIKAH
ncbi:MAG TPA: hypothetical protein VD884_01690 [Ohtaekwangia sp.]|nr:hypothetical protein [Ohtaekwangia sp.]